MDLKFILYFLLGIVACFIWGLAFLIPHILVEVNPVLITCGRYFFYGIISIILGILNWKSIRKLTLRDWLISFILAFFGNTGYYILLTMSIKLSGIVLPALIIGILPVSIMVFGNFFQREYQFKQLILPIILIFAGLLFLNASKLTLVQDKSGAANQIIGIMISFMALFFWTFYSIKNSLYMKDKKHISSSAWAISIGISTLVQSIIGFILFHNSMQIGFAIEANGIFKIITCFVVLGVIVSWLTTVIWNKISRELPVSIVGLILVFETISSLIYSYIYDSTLPTAGELLSIILILAGVVYAMRIKRIKEVQA